MTIDELIRGIHDLGNYLKKSKKNTASSRKISIGSQRQANWSNRTTSSNGWEFTKLSWTVNRNISSVLHPHHKHISPDLKHHRIPAPNLSFAQPNLPF